MQTQHPGPELSTSRWIIRSGSARRLTKLKVCKADDTGCTTKYCTKLFPGSLQSKRRPCASHVWWFGVVRNCSSFDLLASWSIQSCRDAVHKDPPAAAWVAIFRLLWVPGIKVDFGSISRHFIFLFAITDPILVMIYCKSNKTLTAFSVNKKIPSNTV